MSNKTLSQLRDDDFAQNLRLVLKRYHDANQRPTSTQIISDAMAMKPRQYYLSFRTIEAHLKRHRPLSSADRDDCCSSSRQQWQEIVRQINRYLTRNKNATLCDAIDHVINFERPTRFYISERKAMDLFRWTFRREYSFVK